MRIAKALALLVVLLSGVSHASTTTWAEGACDDSSYIFEGATRDFFNRGARLEWKNIGGDWIDDYFTTMGNKPFSTIALTSDSPQTIKIDATSLVQAWATGAIPNHGFYLKSKTRIHNLFYSKDNLEDDIKPVLVIHTSNDMHVAIPETDTEIASDTYRCLGQKTVLNSKNPILLKFALPKLAAPIRKAELLLTRVETSVTPTNIELYAVDIPRFLSFPKRGFSQDFNNLTYLKDDPRVLLYEDFSHGVPLDFQDVLRTNQTAVIENKEANFVPINNKALQIIIDKGTHLGASKYITLSDGHLRRAFMRYHLRFGKNFKVKTTGKLPGFAGTYKGTSLEAGWGGRKSNGKNGWSARGSFGITTSIRNLIRSKTQLGSYLYHADMKGSYGDTVYWNLSPYSMLETEKWYAVEQFLELNSTGKRNGKIQTWINGHLVLSKDDIRFTDEPRIGIEAIWLNVYHGGKKAAPKDLVLFIDDLIVATEYIGSPLNKLRTVR